MDSGTEFFFHNLLFDESKFFIFFLILTDRQGFFSRMTFSWLNPYLRMGYYRSITINDLPPLRIEDTVAGMLLHFEPS